MSSPARQIPGAWIIASPRKETTEIYGRAGVVRTRLSLIIKSSVVFPNEEHLALCNDNLNTAESHGMSSEKKLSSAFARTTSQPACTSSESAVAPQEPTLQINNSGNLKFAGHSEHKMHRSALNDTPSSTYCAENGHVDLSDLSGRRHTQKGCGSKPPNFQLLATAKKLFEGTFQPPYSRFSTPTPSHSPTQSSATKTSLTFPCSAPPLASSPLLDNRDFLATEPNLSVRAYEKASNAYQIRQAVGRAALLSASGSLPSSRHSFTTLLTIASAYSPSSAGQESESERSKPEFDHAGALSEQNPENISQMKTSLPLEPAQSPSLAAWVRGVATAKHGDPQVKAHSNFTPAKLCLVSPTASSATSSCSDYRDSLSSTLGLPSPSDRYTSNHVGAPGLKPIMRRAPTESGVSTTDLIRRKSLGSEFGLSALSMSRGEHTDSAIQNLTEAAKEQSGLTIDNVATAISDVASCTVSSEVIISPDGTVSIYSPSQSIERAQKDRESYSWSPLSKCDPSVILPHAHKKEEPVACELDLRAMNPLELHMYMWPYAHLSTVTEMSEETDTLYSRYSGLSVAASHSQHHRSNVSTSQCCIPPERDNANQQDSSGEGAVACSLISLAFVSRGDEHFGSLSEQLGNAAENFRAGNEADEPCKTTPRHEPILRAEFWQVSPRPLQPFGPFSSPPPGGQSRERDRELSDDCDDITIVEHSSAPSIELMRTASAVELEEHRPWDDVSHHSEDSVVDDLDTTSCEYIQEFSSTEKLAAIGYRNTPKRSKSAKILRKLLPSQRSSQHRRSWSKSKNVSELLGVNKTKPGQKLARRGSLRRPQNLISRSQEMIAHDRQTSQRAAVNAPTREITKSLLKEVEREQSSETHRCPSNGTNFAQMSDPFSDDQGARMPSLETETDSHHNPRSSDWQEAVPGIGKEPGLPSTSTTMHRAAECDGQWNSTTSKKCERPDDSLTITPVSLATADRSTPAQRSCSVTKAEAYQGVLNWPAITPARTTHLSHHPYLQPALDLLLADDHGSAAQAEPLVSPLTDLVISAKASRKFL